MMKVLVMFENYDKKLKFNPIKNVEEFGFT